MIISARFAARAALGGTVLLAGWVTGWLAGLASPSIQHFYAAAIEERNSSAVPTILIADREPADAPQSTAMVPVSNVGGTAVVGRPERMDLSTVVTVLADVAPADLASPKPVSSLAEVAAVDSMSIKETADPESPETPVALASVPAPEVLIDGPLSDSHPPPQPAMQSLASLFTSDPLKQDALLAVRPVETPSECPAPEAKVCIEDYLWAIYERTPKIDTNKVVERVRIKAKVTIKEKKKTRTVTKTFIKTNIKYVLGDFTWKDPIAAKKCGMSLKDYVIGGMDPSFKLRTLSRASRLG